MVIFILIETHNDRMLNSTCNIYFENIKIAGNLECCLDYIAYHV